MLNDFPRERARRQPEPPVATLDDFLSEADLPLRVDAEPRRVQVRPTIVSPPSDPGALEMHHAESLRHAVAPQARRRANGSLVAAAVLGVMFGTIAALRLSSLVATDSLTSTQAPAVADLGEPAAPPRSPAPVLPRATAAETAPPQAAAPPLAPVEPDDRAAATDTPTVSLAGPDDTAKPIASAGTAEAPVPARRVEPSAAKPVGPPAPLVLEPLRDAAPAPVVTELAPALGNPPAPAATEPQQIPPIPQPPVKAEARPESAAPPAPPVAPAVPQVVDERPAIDTLINRYRTAYSELDAPAVKQVWPSASESALSKAFANLDSQNIAFYQCESTVAGATATARCDGQVSYVGRVGPRQRRTQNREWTFTLRKAAGGWEIERVQIR